MCCENEELYFFIFSFVSLWYICTNFMLQFLLCVTCRDSVHVADLCELLEPYLK